MELVIQLVTLLLFSFLSLAEPKVEFLPVDGKKVEYISLSPAKPGPWPLLVLLHPHQERPNTTGARAMLPMMETFSAQGWFTVAVSQPGYGASEGPPDFCGPQSQKAVKEVIRKVRALPSVTKTAVIYGGSRGATLAARIASEIPGLSGLVLKSGVYDLEEAYREYSWLNPVKLAMVWEMKFPSVGDLRERSGFFHLSRAPTLLFHGDQDDRSSVASAEKYINTIRAEGGNAELVTIQSEHIIPFEKISAKMTEFLQKIRTSKVSASR